MNAQQRLREACARLAWRAENFGPGWPPTPERRQAVLSEMRDCLAEIEAFEASPARVIDPTGTDPWPVDARSPGGMSAEPTGGPDPLPVVAGTGAMGVAVPGEEG